MNGSNNDSPESVAEVRPTSGSSPAVSVDKVYEPKHVPALDGVRGLAIVLVVLVHFGAIVRDTPVASWVQTGWIGVDLFFVLSGFLITRILLDTQNTEGFFKRFYIRRGLRIWPLYYVNFVGMILLVHFLGKFASSGQDAAGDHFNFAFITPLYLYLFFLQNFDPVSLFCSRDAMLSITWSLCIEEHFYLVWPVCVRNFSLRTLRWILIVVLAISPFLRLALAYLDRDAPYKTWYHAIDHLTPLHIDSISAGCLLCLLWPDIRKMKRPLTWFGALFGVGLVFSVLCLLNQQNRTIFSFCYTALSAMFVGLIGMTLLGQFSLFFTQPFLRYLGKISFGLYLIHPTVFLFFQSHRVYQRMGLGNHIALAEFLAAVPALILSVCIAHLSWKFFESRVLALKATLAP